MADKYRGYTLDGKWVYGEKIECKRTILYLTIVGQKRLTNCTIGQLV